MNLARMMTDRFFIEDRGGARRGPFKTKFGGSTLMVFCNDLDAAEGDRIIRPLPDGSEQVYVVESCALQTASRNIPGHFAIRIAEPVVAQQTAVPAMPVCAYVTPLDLQQIAASLQALAQAIDQTDYPLQQKSDARALLRAVIENPVVAAALSGTRRTC